MKTVFVALGFLLLLPSLVMAEDEAKILRAQLEEQRALIQQQMQMLQVQQKTIDGLAQRVTELEGTATLVETPVTVDKKVTAAVVGSREPAVAEADDTLERDSEGDLNRGSASAQAGDIEGGFKLPGKGDISLSIGGFAKTVSYFNSDVENQGPIFLPGLLGYQRDNPDGSFNVNANLSRTYLSAIAPVPTGRVRAYLEYDFNKGNSTSADFNLRHAYASYSGRYGEFLVGQYWSTFMDLKVLPEALTDPTMSGAIFSRQPQMRYSLPIGTGFTLHTAIEDPNSNDVFSDEPTSNLTSQPDYVMGMEYDDPGRWHVRLNGILRDIEVELPSGEHKSDDGWGFALTGSVRVFENDKLAMGGTYGEGLGRYMLGLQPDAGGVVDTDNGELVARENWGGFMVYSHQWQPGLRSALTGGYAEAKPESFQSDLTFNNTVYGGVNLLWSPLPYLTLGVEYVYGQSENNDGTDQDNHRILFGAQFF